MNLMLYILIIFALRNDWVLSQDGRIFGGMTAGQTFPRELSSRIVGGKPTSKSYPFVVSYQLKYSYYSKHSPYDLELRFDDWAHFCGGSIISKRHVVTAGHCMKGYPVVLENVSFLAGANKLNGNGTRYNIERFLIHDNFEETDYGIINDIALLYSACTIFPVKDMIQAIPYNNDFIEAGVLCTVMGWGYTRQGADKSVDLLELQTTTISNEECKRDGLSRVGDAQMCTFSKKGEGFCQADSGGPLVKDNKLVGVVSYNAGCGAGNPDVYIRVSFYNDWLKNNTST